MLLANQLLRSGTAIGAHYRAACRGKSLADVVSKLGWVEEEGDESLYWMELLTESGYVKTNRIDPLQEEIDEILAMTVASINTLRRRMNESPIENRHINPKSKIRDPKS